MRERLDLIFYRFYLFQFTIKNAAAAEFTALLHISCVLLLHFFTIDGLLYALWDIKLFDWSFPILIGVLLGTMVINYVLFIFSQRNRKIIKEHRNESGQSTRKGNKQIAIYTLVTFLMWCFSLFLMVARNNGMLTLNSFGAN